ncbi:cell surface protein [Listeria seeligeri]|uniref:LapB repeat-containing protein n=1 Tax=Listeria seeligeri TaxID=1640 RepID=UPI00194324A2|nr:LapB repeat-containing protein [Listeria seeligeri]MBM5694449.1 cell surface protein [Listeria seeligeri]
MKRKNSFFTLLIVACVVFSSLWFPTEVPVKAVGGGKRDDLVKSVSFYKSNGNNVSPKEDYNENLDYFIDISFAGNSFQVGDYFDVTLSKDALLYTGETYDLTIDVDPTSAVKQEVVGEVSVNQNGGVPTLHFAFTENSDDYFVKDFTGNFKIQLMPLQGGKNSISLNYNGATQNFKNINSSTVELNVNVMGEWPPLGTSNISRVSGDLYRAQQVYEKPKSKVNYETEILVSYPLFEEKIPLGNVQNVRVEIWDETRGIYRPAITGVEYGTITYDVGTPFIGGPSYKMNCTIPFIGISSKTRVTFDINTNIDGKSGSTDPYLIGLSSVTAATKSVQFYPIDNAESNLKVNQYGKVTTSFEDENGAAITFDDYSEAAFAGELNEDGEYEIDGKFLYNSTQSVDKHAFDEILEDEKYKLVDVSSENQLTETEDNLNIQIKLGYENDVLYKIKKLQKPVIQALPEIEYSKTVIKTKEEFLGDVEATTDIPAVIDCDLKDVEWGVPGDYPVVITAVNEDNQEADPVTVMVHILKNPAPVISVDPEITYKKTVTKTDDELLTDVNARTNDGSVITSDIDDKVKWGVPGDYEVTLNAMNEDEVAAESKTFTVHILKSPAPIIAVDPEITYLKSTTKTEPELLADVHAQTNDGSPIVSDMLTEVKWGVPGEYPVTLNSMNEDGVAAESKTFIVKILKDPAPIITVDPEITYDSKTKKEVAELLAEVHAQTNDGSAITSDAESQVKWGVPGEYPVTLNSMNEDGVAAESKTFIVKILKNPAPVITVDPEITYDSKMKKEVAELLSEVHAQTNDGSAITSDAESQVKWGVPGDYLVTLNAVNEHEIAAEPVSFTVHIVEAKEKPVPKDKPENKLTVNEKKLPQTGDKNSEGVLGFSALCLGLWLFFRNGRLK